MLHMIYRSVCFVLFYNYFKFNYNSNNLIIVVYIWWSVFVRDFSTKKNVTTLNNPPYTPALTPADFYVFPVLNSALKGVCFCDATDITKNVTGQGEYLKELYLK